MREEDLVEWERRLRTWWQDKLADMDELEAFREFGARQCQVTARYEPNVPRPCSGTSPAGCGAPGTEKCGDEYVCKSCLNQIHARYASVGRGSCFDTKGVLKPGTFRFGFTGFQPGEKIPENVYRSAAQRLTSKIDSVFTGTVTADGKTAEEICVPKLMKCPRCGTNPARCEKPLTDEEKSCFVCGSGLEPL